MRHMNIILLSGGSGKRLWPLSNEVRSKQFIKIFKNGDSYESMVQRVYRQIKSVDKDAVVTIATSKSQVSTIRNQIGHDVGISIEPCRRDTFPAIVLATAYLHDVQGVSEGEAVAVCPVDPFVNEDYFVTVKKLGEQAEKGEANLVLMGIEPTYPSEKYGYIIPETGDSISLVESFKEKPDELTAKRYIKQGALWNGGVFAYKIGYVLKTAREILGTSDYDELYRNYADLTKISFDYAVAEKEKKIQVMRFGGQWMDVGTWNTLTEVMDDRVVGQGILDGTCENVHILNELDVPVLCMGLKNAVVAASAEGILVSDKYWSAHIKPYVDKLEGPAMFAEKSWGDYRVLDVNEEAMTVKLTIKAGHNMNYHSHMHRDEVWTVVSGEGIAIVDGMETPVRAGDVITMEAGCKHTIRADTELKVIEVQLGKEISVHDKQKYDLP